MPILTTLVGAVSASPAWAGAAATRAVTDRTSAARRVILRPYIDTESGTVSEDQGMAHVTCTALAYAHPGGDLLFSDVSFHVKPGDHVGVVGAAIGEWSALGGYELEAQWDTACRRIVRSSFAELADRPAVTLSGGERKRLVLDVLFASDAEILMLDEPDNFLDVPAKRELERQIAGSRKTVLLISHDRDLLASAVRSVLTLEGNGCWVHPGSYATYPEAREARQKKLGDAVKRWRDEERRLHRLMKTFKERAQYASDWAKRAEAMETRWRR